MINCCLMMYLFAGIRTEGRLFSVYIDQELTGNTITCFCHPPTSKYTFIGDFNIIIIKKKINTIYCSNRPKRRCSYEIPKPPVYGLWAPTACIKCLLHISPS